MKYYFLTVFTLFVLTTENFAQNVPPYVPTNGLVGWWPFTNNSNDESGNGNNGTVNGATLTTDRFGNANKAFNFNGSSDYIEALSSPSLQISNAYTISLWFNANIFNNGSYGRTLISKIATTGWYGGYEIMIGENNLIGGINHTGNINGNFQLPFSGLSAANWYSVVVSFDGAQLNMYIDGLLVNTVNQAGALQTGNDPFRFGRRGGGGIYDQWYNGKIDDIGIWNRVLTECEILDLYNARLNSASGVNAGNDVTACEGDQVTLSGSGGSNYQWSGGIQNNTAFTASADQDYILTAANANGCLGADTVSVIVNELPVVDAGNNVTVCEGDEVTLSGSGADSYVWDNSVTDGVAFTANSAQTYTVTGTDANNCENTDQVTVNVNTHSASTINETGVDSVNVNGTYYTQSGQYTQIIPNVAGCDSTITINVSLTFTGINELSSGTVSVYPNPTQDIITLTTQANHNGMSYIICDAAGKIILKGNITSTTQNISLNGFAAGIYTISIEGMKGKNFMIIKE